MRLTLHLHFHLAAILLLLLLLTASATAQEFDRGDPNVYVLYDIGDPIFNLGCLFANGQLNCLDAQDPNDGGMVRSKKRLRLKRFPSELANATVINNRLTIVLPAMDFSANVTS